MTTDTDDAPKSDEASEDAPASAAPDSEAPITERDPVIETLAPLSGPLVGGTRVRITGTGFAEGVTLEVDGASVTAEYVSATELTFVTPPRINAGKAPVVVIVDKRRSEPELFEFKKPDAPSIVSIAPSSGPLSGGTELVIGGLHFVDGARVRVGDIEAPAVVFEAAIQLRATTPARVTAGKVDVRVELPDGQSAVLADAFEYERNKPPRIERVEPRRGPAVGGTRVTIEGSFAPGCTVDIGGTVVVPSVEGSSLTFVTPPSATGGVVYLSVTNPDTQIDLLSHGFEYDEPRDPPFVEDVWPRRGVPEQPARINIEGKAFALPCRVEVGGVLCEIQQLTETSIVAIVPPRAAVGDVDVVVTNPDGQSHTLPGGFSWTPPAIEPAVASVTPQSGPLLGGTTIVLTGAGFDDKTYVQILDHVVVGELIGEGRLSLRTPRAPKPGPVDIRVMNSEGSSCTVEGGFTYELLELPTVTGISPARGPITGGTRVVVEGTGFHRETGVILDRGTRPQNVVVESATRMVITMPPGERAGAIDMKLVCPDGQTITRTKAFLYEPIPPPSIDRWDPKYGSAAGGWKLTVEGKNFAPGCFVIVGGTAARTRRIDDKNVEATVAAFEASAFADVAVRNPDGQQAVAKNAVQVTRR